METIFDHNPTKEEIAKITSATSESEYREKHLATKETELLWICLLYERRGDAKKAKKYRDQVPDLYDQWVIGNDDVAIPVND